MSGSKIIKDCIYGHITIPKLCVDFMDTPEFQRLRRVRQLGSAHYAYPSAVHTRFEHCIGVMHLAGKMVDHLRQYSSIDNRTKELIQLAGMYHDIGHFAYSHLFDKFLSKTNVQAPDIMNLHDHEDRSLFFLKSVNSRLHVLNEQEQEFVENAIRGYVPEGHPPYLYQIVCNSACGLDMDKADYLRRDSFHTGFPGFQADYIIACAVIDKENHIAFKQKAYGDLKDLFETRRRMYENVYQHHTACKIDKIILCMMKRLGAKLFTYNERTDDYNIETLFRESPETYKLINAIDNRELDHNCEVCREYHTVKHITQSGSIDKVRFV
jgi:HD superfamily phosphohydrolase